VRHQASCLVSPILRLSSFGVFYVVAQVVAPEMQWPLHIFSRSRANRFNTIIIQYHSLIAYQLIPESLVRKKKKLVLALSVNIYCSPICSMHKVREVKPGFMLARNPDSAGSMKTPPVKLGNP
jgi:hypothetical protein